MRTKLCLPLCLNDFSEVEEQIHSLNKDFDYFEIWFDYLTECSLERLSSLIDRYPERLLLLFRRKNLEPIKKKEEERREVIDSLRNAPLYFDFDITTQLEDLKYFVSSEYSSKLITSYHNYTETPRREELDSIVETMKGYNPDILKIASFCKSPSDSLLLLSLLHDLSKADSAPIVLGMGEHGAVTRCFGGEFGNIMTFVTASEDDQGTAPGQLTRDDLIRVEAIIQRLKG